MASETLAVLTAEDERVVSSKKQANEILEIADTITIDSPEMNELANDSLSSLKAASKELDSRKAGIIDPLNKALKAARDLFRPAEEALATAEVSLKRKIAGWLDQQDGARRKAEIEARAKQAESVAAAEAVAVATLEDPNASVAERESALAEATLATIIAPPVAHVETGRMGGNSSTKKWKAEFQHVPSFLRYLADDLESQTPKFDNTVDLKLGQLQKFASITKGTVAIPGVRFYEERSITART